MPGLRLLSLSISSALVAALILLAGWPVRQTIDEDAAPHAVLLSIENKIAPAPKKAARAPSSVLNAMAEEGDGEALTLQLWHYNVSGQILFETWDQHHRCTRARVERRDEADCPSFLDRTPIAAAPRRPSALVIALDDIALPRYASPDRRD